ncbi:MAG: hotdog fold thioesterase [Bacteroidaceae bacterium]|nr:hotdog fold thioesterase [Bacteroidaceae bacterium]
MTLKEFIEGDNFARRSGVRLLSVAKNSGKAELVVTAEHLNAGGLCQGGAIFTLADTALALAANSGLMLTLSVDAAIYYHRAAMPGDVLTAEAVALCAHPKLPSFEVKVTNQRGELVASFKSTCYTKKAALNGVTELE